MAAQVTPCAWLIRPTAVDRCETRDPRREEGREGRREERIDRREGRENEGGGERGIAVIDQPQEVFRHNTNKINKLIIK